jgi:tetratricopeptide (TPR) repeat protein
MDAADLAGALTSARALRQEVRTAGPDAYKNAGYDIALSSLLLAQTLDASGRADEALVAAAEAEHDFRELAAAGSTEAAHMAAASLSQQANALKDLGRLDEAATAYEKAIEEAEVLGDRRAAALRRGQLGTVRGLQGHHADAIAAHDQARRTFEDLGEPLSVAIAWHRIGMGHLSAGRLDAAERAYLRSLDITTRLHDRVGQASTLNALGGLYAVAGRPEESADNFRRAADLYAAIGDQRSEGAARNNLAICLHGLQRYVQARVEAEHALELTREFGHAAHPWSTWSILSDIEQGLGNTEAAPARDPSQRGLEHRRPFHVPALDPLWRPRLRVARRPRARLRRLRRAAPAAREPRVSAPPRAGVTPAHQRAASPGLLTEASEQ